MAENQALTPENEPVAPTKPRMSLTGKLLVGAFMAGVILMECAIAYFMIPTPEQVAAVAEANMAKRYMERPEDLIDDDGILADDGAPEAEVDLGSYSITYQNGSSMLRIDLGLAGTLKEEEQAEFEDLFKEKERRFSQMINVEVRSAELIDLQDPKLGLIRRRILEKSNALFGKQILRDVLVSQFFIIEQ